MGERNCQHTGSGNFPSSGKTPATLDNSLLHLDKVFLNPSNFESTVSVKPIVKEMNSVCSVTNPVTIKSPDSNAHKLQALVTSG